MKCTMLGRYIQLVLYALLHLVWSAILAYVVRVGDASIYCELICYLVIVTGALMNLYLVVHYYREYKPELYDTSERHTSTYVYNRYRGIFYVKLNICIVALTLFYIVYDTTLPL